IRGNPKCSYESRAGLIRNAEFGKSADYRRIPRVEGDRFRNEVPASVHAAIEKVPATTCCNVAPTVASAPAALKPHVCRSVNSPCPTLIQNCWLACVPPTI